MIGDDVEDVDDPVLLADQQLRDLFGVPGHRHHRGPEVLIFKFNKDDFNDFFRHRFKQVINSEDGI